MEKEKKYLKPDRLKKELDSQYEELCSMQQYLKDVINDFPEGHLKITKKKNCPQYYHRRKEMEQYIPKDNLQLACDLAQKTYYKNVLRVIEKQMEVLEYMKENYAITTVDEIYNQLIDERKQLVEPIFIPDDLYMERWTNVQYQQKTFAENTPIFHTENGEQVRSKSEVIIASKLRKENIPYHYEYPLRLGNITVYPDFVCLNIRTRQIYIWEHFGMMDNPEYVERAIKKINHYQMNNYYLGINFICTFETSSQPLNIKVVEDLIQTYLI